MEKLIKAEAILLVFLFLLLIILLLITSKIRIEINNFKFSGEILNKKDVLDDLMEKEKKESYLNDNYNIKISLNVLIKIPILWININKKKIEKLKQNKKFKNIKFKNATKDIDIQQLKHAKEKINIKIKQFHLDAQIGTDSTIFTTMIIPLISSIISYILAKRHIKQKNFDFKIKPIFNMR